MSREKMERFIDNLGKHWKTVRISLDENRKHQIESTLDDKYAEAIKEVYEKEYDARLREIITHVRSSRH